MDFKKTELDALLVSNKSDMNNIQVRFNALWKKNKVRKLEERAEFKYITRNIEYWIAVTKNVFMSGRG